MSYKICPVCQTKNEPNAVICSNCMTDISTIEPQEENNLILKLMHDNFTLSLDKDETIGRKAFGSKYLTNEHISRNHAKIIFENGSVYIEDLNSTNGTFINDSQIKPKKKYKLREADTIKLSSYVKLKVNIQRATPNER